MQTESTTSSHTYDGPYRGHNLDRIAFPIGGLGAGMFCLEGSGAISEVSRRGQLEFFKEPRCFAALHVKGERPVSRFLEGPLPDRKYFGDPASGNGSAGKFYGLPRFGEASFMDRFPFATIDLRDPSVPLKVQITGWSPFTPGDADSSSLPVGALEYTFINPTDKPIESVFSFNSTNFMALDSGGDSIEPIEGGFVLKQDDSAGAAKAAAVAIYTAEKDVIVDHGWFKGGWWNAITLAWHNIDQGRLMDNPPAEGSSPGASLFVPFTVEPGGSRTIRLMIAWYAPQTALRIGNDPSGNAFAAGPAPGTSANQLTVSGYLGKGLVNTYHPSGDAQTGTLTSPEFTVTGRYLHFLIGGGHHPGETCLNLMADGQVVATATGMNTEQLRWETFDMATLAGKPVRVQIVDKATGEWGHVLVDQIMMTDLDRDEATAALDAKGAPVRNTGRITVLADFEGPGFGDWEIEPKPEAATCASGACCASGGTCEAPAGQTEASLYYQPWYAGQFKCVACVAKFWTANYDDLRQRSAAFRDAFYDTTLPPEVIEAIAANLTIMKSPTVLRQTDGRLWGFEGCSDNAGCCHGSCTHVWNYAQAFCHLFPALERSLRETEFFVSQDETGHQAFRTSLPIRPTIHNFHAAADGQLGGIMTVYREWRISGDEAWLRKMWPKVRQSLDFCIRTWDPRGHGLIEEPHHNTYDIEFWGPDGMCASFYLGALDAAVAMGDALGDDVSGYEKLAAEGRRRLETDLYNGEYFYQRIQTEGLSVKFNPINTADNGPGYGDLVELINQQGPRYQYGTGCLSDGVLGFWMARMCGMDGDLIDPAKLRSNLKAIYTYNFKPDLSAHANPQRPTYAMGDEGGLLLCTWPRGGKLVLPFIYSDEVWTGIEYQVASHLMSQGMVREGLDIVRACRDRYDGVRRNPFNEYECGHWYARAMSSYGLLQGLTGVRYDAVDQTLHIDSRVGDNFRSFLATDTGYGTVGLKDGKPFLEVRAGRIDVEKCMVSGKALALMK